MKDTVRKTSQEHRSHLPYSVSESSPPPRVVFFQIVVGSRPYRAFSGARSRASRQNPPPVFLYHQRSRCPGDLANCVAALLCPDRLH